MAELLTETRRRCPELAGFLSECMESPLRFDGPFPIMHSADNHIHLWALEYWADRHGWIDLAYRVAFAEAILGRWRERLKGYGPYQARGYRLYLYEDLAPTVSVVAETDTGCPYGLARLVDAPSDVMAGYVGRSWAEMFVGHDVVTPEQILRAVERQSGSISKPTAQTLGMQVGHLRRWIEWFEIGGEVNSLRKRFKRRPAQFRQEHAAPVNVWEQVLPARY